MSNDLLESMKWPRNFDEPEGRVLYSIKSFQIIETILKLYLTCPSRSMNNYSAETIKNEPFGILLKKFKRNNDNKGLHDLLSELVNERNKIAHHALVIENGEIARLLNIAPIELKELREIDSKASKAMTKLVCEYIKTQPKQESFGKA